MKKNVSKKQGSRKGYSGDDVKRYLGSLSEDFQHRISGIGEQFGGLNKKLDEHSRLLHTHSEMIGRLLLDVQEIKNEKVGRSDFAQLEKRVVRIENVLHGVRGK